MSRGGAERAAVLSVRGGRAAQDGCGPGGAERRASRGGIRAGAVGDGGRHFPGCAPGARLAAGRYAADAGDRDPAAARALVPDAEIDAVFARLLAIVGPAASCDPYQPMAIPESVPGFYANQLIAMDQATTPDPRPALAGLGVPVLVLRGECDYKRWEITREYREVFRADLVCFPDAGHAIEFDQPELFVDTVVGFLTGGEMPLPLYTGEADPAL